MASLHRAVVMLRKLNLSIIPLAIRDALRELQEAYSTKLRLDEGGSSEISGESAIEDAEGVLHKPPGGNEASRKLQSGCGLETELEDAVRGLSAGMGNTMGTGGARGKEADMRLPRWIHYKKEVQQK